MEWTGIKAKFTVKTMKLSWDKSALWMTGELEVPSPDRIGQEASGSDFFIMDDTTIKCDVALLDPDLVTGDILDVIHTGQWFKPVEHQEREEIKMVLDCNGKCTEGCPKYDGKFCTDTG